MFSSKKDLTMTERYLVKSWPEEQVWYVEDTGEIIARVRKNKFVEGWQAWYTYNGQFIGEFIDYESAVRAVDNYKVRVHK